MMHEILLFYKVLLFIEREKDKVNKNDKINIKIRQSILLLFLF